MTLKNAKVKGKYFTVWIVIFVSKIAIHFFSDPRVRGFSKDGIFGSDFYRSYYALFNLADTFSEEKKLIGSLMTYILATKTSFFGKKFNKKWRDLYNDENVVFMSQLFARSLGSFYNSVSDVRLYFILQIYFNCFV